ncbi:MAG: hypothetical protein L0Y32_05605 [Nevskiales bacterium]|nr:hypothetical protein [Nevskiales bacterium]
MLIIGINAYHGDSSACLLRDGRLVAAAEEERFRRVKHWAGFPSRAIRYCLEEGGVGLDAVDHVAINSNPRAGIWRKLGYTLSRRPGVGLLRDRLRNARRRLSLQQALAAEFTEAPFRGRVHRIEHHRAHLASCFYVSPFDEAVALSVDGFGDFASAAWGIGRDRTLSVDGRIYFPHSLGIFYQALTQYLGFPNYGDEYKVMGLAPYGKPVYVSEMREMVHLQADGSYRLNLEYFRHHTGRISYTWDNGEPVIGTLYSPALTDLLGPARTPDEPLDQRHRDLAHSVQAMYEEAFFHLLGALHRRYKVAHLTLAGGCAMNSVANGKIYHRSPFKRVYVQSAAGDAGGAIGAAFEVSHRLNHGDERFRMDHAYCGPEFSDGQIATLLDGRGTALTQSDCAHQRIGDEQILCERTARAIADGRVVGWFQGRMEWGPRALGNRSILGDPRRADMKDILNRKIKRRESFRPFAPSILRQSVPAWFETDDDVPFMMAVFQIREDQRSRIPAVTHVDGSGRLQTVHRETNPRYYRLIERFGELTQVPMVLNTSFNENEPVVCRPEEALDCFLRTRMDVLVLGNWFVERRS